MAGTYPSTRLARICRRLALNPATELGAEVQGLSHPFSWSDFALADLHVAASRGIASPHWSRPEVTRRPVAQVAAEWNSNYERFKTKNAKPTTEGAPDAC